MTENHRESVSSYHTNCLQDDMTLVPLGPGAFAVVLRREFRIHSPFDTEVIRLPAGTPLLGQAQVESLKDAVHHHLHGSTDESDLRLGVSLFLGHDPANGIDQPLATVLRAEIDGWLGANTAFIFWPRSGTTSGTNEDGFFAGVARSWAARQKGSPALH